MHSNIIGTMIMNAINMQVTENIAEHQWEAIYFGNKSQSLNKMRDYFLPHIQTYLIIQI